MTYGPTKTRDMFSEDYLENRIEFLMSKVVKTDDGHWLFTGAGDGNGYGKLAVKLDGKIWYPKAHAFSYLYHKGDLITRMDVCHTCGERRCVNPEHLYLGTRNDNMVDAGRDGTARYHGRPPRLLDQQVREIRKLYRQGIKCVDIARQFGIEHQAISLIGRNLSYKWVPDN